MLGCRCNHDRRNTDACLFSSYPELSCRVSAGSTTKCGINMTIITKIVLIGNNIAKICIELAKVSAAVRV